MSKPAFSRFDTLTYAFKNVLEKLGIWVIIAIGQLKTFFYFFSILTFIAGTILYKLAFFKLLPLLNSIHWVTTGFLDWWFRLFRLPIVTQKLFLFSEFRLGLGLSFLFFFFLVNSIWSLIGARIAILTYEKKKLTIRGVLPSVYDVACDFFASIYYWTLVILGLCCFVVPGLIFMSRFWFYRMFVVDKGQGPIAAMKMSWNITRGHGKNVFVMIALLDLENLILGVTIFITLPMMFLANSYMYKKLTVMRRPK